MAHICRKCEKYDGFINLSCVFMYTSACKMEKPLVTEQQPGAVDKTETLKAIENFDKWFDDKRYDEDNRECFEEVWLAALGI